MYNHFYESPIGTIHITATDEYLTSVLFVNVQSSGAIDFLPSSNDLTVACQEQLEAYFGRTRKVFDLPIFQSGTDFQEMIRAVLSTIPYGETRSYPQIAAQIGRPDAVRAVAAAIGQNSLDLIVPCHRVISSSGGLTGYNGGISRKRFLLQLEQDSIFSST